MTARLLALFEDTIAFCAACVGIWLVLHMLDRVIFGLFINGALS
ncbi:hypothetical protein [Alteriqipengyuania sp.]